MCSHPPSSLTQRSVFSCTGPPCSLKYQACACHHGSHATYCSQQQTSQDHASRGICTSDVHQRIVIRKPFAASFWRYRLPPVGLRYHQAVSRQALQHVVPVLHMPPSSLAAASAPPLRPRRSAATAQPLRASTCASGVVPAESAYDHSRPLYCAHAVRGSRSTTAGCISPSNWRWLYVAPCGRSTAAGFVSSARIRAPLSYKMQAATGCHFLPMS